MMGMPTGPGAAGRKLYFFKLVQLSEEPRKFEAKLKSFIKNPDELSEIGEKLKKILDASGDLEESNLETKTFVIIVPEENADAFMEAAMKEACIFRF